MLVHVHEPRPRADAWNLERDVDRIFRSFWSDADVPAPSASFDSEVTPDTHGVTVRAHVPGVEPSAISITVEGRALTISAERSSEKPSDGKYQLRERRYGKFSRTFYLPDELDVDAIDAQCRNGVLTVRIPTRPETTPRQIEIKTA